MKPNSTELNIDGMTCGHCVMSITKALEAVPGVESAKVNLAEKRATVIGSAQTADLVAAVTEEGYQATPVSAESKEPEASGCSCCQGGSSEEA